MIAPKQLAAAIILVSVCDTSSVVEARQVAMPTAMQYQGRLMAAGSPVDGTADFQFTLWNASSGGAQVGGLVTVNAATVAEGLFTTPIDFGSSAFNGDARWLEVAVRSPAGSGSFSTLVPRQPLTPVPYALQTRGLFTDDTGNVGIGTASPAQTLHVAAADSRLRLHATANNTYAVTEYVTDARTWHTGVGASNSLGALNGKYYLYDNTNAQTRLVVDTAGNVGIGTALPNKRLTVAGSMEIGTGAGDYQHLRIGGGNSSGFLYGSFLHFADGIHLGYNYYADGAGANQIPAPGGGTSRISMGYGFVALATQGAGFGEPVNRLVVDNVVRVMDNLIVTNPDSGTAITATSTYIGAPAVYAEHASANTSAVVGLASWTSGSGTGVHGQSNSPSGWDFWAGGAGVNYGAPSSIRWKRNIELIGDPLERLEQMRGVTYDWDAEHGGQRDVGFIGEEVGKVLPEVVVYEPDGQFVTGMDYSKVTPLLVEAIKALRAEKDAQISDLQKVVAAQQAQIEQLLARVEALETHPRR